MGKVLRTDRPEKTEQLPTKVTQLPSHDFNANPVFEGVYFGTDPAGHYFGVVAPEIMLPFSDSLKTVNAALTADIKGKKVRIEYLGIVEETDDDGNATASYPGWEVSLID